MRGPWLYHQSAVNAMKTTIGKGNVDFVSKLPRKHLSSLKLMCGSERAYHKQRVSTNAPALPWTERQSHCSALRQNGSVLEFRLLQSVVSSPSRSICTSALRPNAQSNGTLSTVAGSVGQIKPKLALRYKCKICDHENSHTFSKESYEAGVVIVQCQSCNSHHLIADNLGWFADKDRQKSVKGMLESQVKVNKSKVRSSKQEDGTIEVEVDK